MTHHRDSSPVASDYLAGVRRLCRDLLNAQLRGELTLDPKAKQRLEDIERERYQLATERLLLSALAAAPDPAYRQEYLELVRSELGMTRAAPDNIDAIDELEDLAQGDHDVAWGRFCRLVAKGVRCRVTARLARKTAVAHKARLNAQITYLTPFL